MNIKQIISEYFPEETPCKCVVFDLDGTLYDKHLLPLRMVLADWKHIGLLRAERACRKQLAGQYFGDEKALYTQLFSLMSQQTGKTAEQVAQWYTTIYMPTMAEMLRKHYTARPWVQHVFQTLEEQNIRIVVFSDYGCVAEKLEALQLTHYPLSIYSAPEMGGLKPCKEAFLNLLNTLAIKPENALMIGDREDTDGQGAKNAGMKFHLLNE